MTALTAGAMGFIGSAVAREPACGDIRDIQSVRRAGGTAICAQRPAGVVGLIPGNPIEILANKIK